MIDLYGKFTLEPPLAPEHKQFLEEFSCIQHDGTETPSRYCQWVPTPDGAGLTWDGLEKFWDYEEWLVYLVEHYLKPWGYSLSGEVRWQGDFNSGRGGGILYALNNQIEVVPDRIINPGPSWAKRERVWQEEGSYKG